MFFFHIKIKVTFDYFVKYIKFPPYNPIIAKKDVHPAIVVLVDYLKKPVKKIRRMKVDEVIETLNIIYTNIVNTQRYYEYTGKTNKLRMPTTHYRR